MAWYIKIVGFLGSGASDLMIFYSREKKNVLTEKNTLNFKK